MSNGVQLIVARSNLQLLLSTALAYATHQQYASRLVFLPDMQEADWVERVLQRWSLHPFARMDVLRPKEDAMRSGKLRPWREWRRKMAHIVAETRPDVVTLFNDRQEIGQAVLIEVARCFPQALRQCVEDGATAYVGFTYRAHSAVTCWRERLRVGRGWTDVQVLGTHPLVQQFVALTPELVRPELRHRPPRAFPVTALDAPPIQSLARLFCEAVEFDESDLVNGAVLLTLSHSSYIARNPEYLSMVKQVVMAVRRRGMPLLYKYHPRERAADLLQMASIAPDAREVPRAIPVECLYLLVRAQRITIVGGMSSALLTASRLLPDTTIVALVHESSVGDKWDESLMRRFNIVPVHEVTSSPIFSGG